MELLNKFVNIIYRTKRARQKYLKSYPSEKILAANATKGVRYLENQTMMKSTDWIGSQRAVLLLTNRKIVCGKWEIPLEDINNSELIKIKTLDGPGQILKISTKNQGYFQFGMQVNRQWDEQTALSLIVSKGKVKYSMYSIIIRIVFYGVLVYSIVRYLLDLM
jgi:hypothetical protein